jgi:uncharacterized protein YyaL (SSP411 family)
VVLAGDAHDLREMVQVVRERFLPDSVTMVNPPVTGSVAVEGRATAYVCRNFTCELPVTDVEKLKALLQ